MKTILIKPLITEKTSAATERNNQFSFIVNKEANKIEIRKAIESEYKVSVKDVRTVNVDGKLKTKFTKTGVVSGRTPSFKKAIISLSAGESIDFYENL
ncbi:MAG: 50S ribosomal protein L23 [Flavobacteriales bacterium]